jgi:endonuclease-3
MSRPDIMDLLLPRLRELAGAWHGPLIGDAVKAHGRDPYLVLVGTLLSLRTKDETTAVALPRLWAQASHPAAMVALGTEAIARLIYPVGFYNNKAATLVQVSQLLLDEHRGLVPATMEALLALPGVGRKTANLVLSEGFGIPAICVDTHVHRISNRLGYVTTQTPEETEQALRAKLPPHHWHSINELLVLFGQNLCKPLSPLCSQCPITTQCPKTGVAKRR